MTNEPINQAINQIESATNIMVLSGSGANLDAVAAGLAMKEFLARQDKQVRVFALGPVSDKIKFIPESAEVLPTDRLHKNTVIEVSLAKTELSELSYQKLPQALKIFLTPKSGEFETEDIKVTPASYPFDLVIVLGVSSLEALGSFYSAHAQLFFDTPVLNIDYRPDNENFGQINLVTLTSSSVSEITFDLLESTDPNLLDEKIATLLLTGLIFATNSFQSQKTSPQVFQKASRLVGLGGKQQEIISQLYRSKSLGLLHLWGRVLARLKQETEDSFVYSSLPATDIQRSEATESDQNEIIPEMAQQLSFAKHFGFLVENGDTTTVFLSLSSPLSAVNLFAAYSPLLINQQTAKFIINKPLAVSEQEVLNTIKQELAKYRG